MALMAHEILGRQERGLRGKAPMSMARSSPPWYGWKVCGNELMAACMMRSLGIADGSIARWRVECFTSNLSERCIERGSLPGLPQSQARDGEDFASVAIGIAVASTRPMFRQL
jgi:hypothetical protein